MFHINNTISNSLLQKILQNRSRLFKHQSTNPLNPSPPRNPLNLRFRNPHNNLLHGLPRMSLRSNLPISLSALSSHPSHSSHSCLLHHWLFQIPLLLNLLDGHLHNLHLLFPLSLLLLVNT